MQENDFEKQVHKKMGELRLAPSEAVWEQVEMRLHEKEKRRRWLIWFPLLAVGLTIGSYLALNSGHPTHSGTLSNKEENAGQSTAKQHQAPDGSTKIGTTNNVYLQPNSLKTAGEKNAGNNSVTISPSNTGPVTSNQNANTSATSSRKKNFTAALHRVNNQHKRSGATLANNNDRKLFDPVSKQTAPPATPFTTRAGSDEIQINNEENETLSIELDRVTVAGPLPLTDPIHTAVAQVDERQALKTIINKPHAGKGLKWGFSFDAGKLSLTSGSLNKIFSSQSDALSFSSPNFSSSGNPTGTPIYTEPYPIRASAAFSAGAFVRKNLSPRFALSVGVNYTYYSTASTVGKKVDSSFLSNITGNAQLFDRYFRVGVGGSMENYINRYHYLEIPIALQTKLTRYWKRPLYWDLGLSVSRLLASNALHFDKSTGFYYKDNDLLNKTQFNFLTAVPLALASGKSFELQAGPQFQYGFSRITINESSTGKHFLFVGLKLNLVFGK